MTTRRGETLLAPSILSADFSRLAEEIHAVEKAGVRMLHVDVMDGHFVPNLTIGPPVVASIRAVTSLKLDTHLMVEHPDRLLEAFVEAGADMISVHAEACHHLHRTVTSIRSAGREAGVVLNPATPLHVLDEILPDVNYVLLMSVNPGFGGQTLIRGVLDKMRRLREWVDRLGLPTRLEIDGGVGLDNLEEVAATGVDMIVAGSAIFGSGDPRGTTARMVRMLAEAAERGARG